MKSKTFLPLLFSLLLAACTTQSPTLTDEQKDTIKTEVTQQWDKISGAVSSADAGTFTSFVSDDLIAMYSHGVMIPNKAVYADSLSSWFSARQSVVVNPKKLTLTVIDSDNVLLDQFSDFRVTFKDGQVLDITHAVSFLFRKESSGWMIIHGHESW